MAQNHKLALPSGLLRDLRSFWYEHVSEEGMVLPTQENNKRWYMGGAEFDQLCVQRYAPTLEAIRGAELTSGADVVAAAQPQEPLDWLSLVLLLDQIPRNAYRGAAAKTVFSYFDPLARDVAGAAVERGVTETPEIRWRMAYRMWFFMPMMHSEDAALHEEAVRQYERVVRDVEALLESDGSSNIHDAYQRSAAAVVKARGDEAKTMAARSLEFERRHQVIIQRFGRYPHRNAALGREPTAEEEAYLREGGETFSG